MADIILDIRDLHVKVGDNEIIRGIDLQIERGTVHALMGPNGSGKSTLSLVLMGHPKYTVTKGDIFFQGKSILELPPNERSLAGMFLAFQYPSAVPGVSVANFMRNTLMARHKGDAPLTPAKFKGLLDNAAAKLKMEPKTLGRYVNDGFSGGEKKRLEMLQMLVLQPTLAILDETDSGLDIDALAHHRRGHRGAALAGTFDPAHHALPAHLELRQARRRPRARQRPHRQRGRPGARARARGIRLRSDHQRTRTGVKARNKMALEQQQLVDKDYKYGFHDQTASYSFKSRKGIDHDIVEQISQMKNEPQWMRDFRHKSLDIFLAKPFPAWAKNEVLEAIDFADIFYYMRASDRGEGKTWDDVPEDIKRTFDRLGIPEAERKFLGGVTAQYDSEVVYHSIRKDLEAKGVLFGDMDTALREHEDIVREHFATVIPPADNKFSALNSAVWSGGSFIWVPPGVQVDIPLQAYFRINAENMGQFERTLIIAEPGSFVHYIEGCTAPTYSSNSLHSAVVELIAKEGAHIRYTTIQNWYKNIYNLVTKRAMAHKNAHVEWVDGNIGSKLTMKYPSVYLVGEGARGEVLSIAYASEGQHQDAGAKMIHAAPNTTSIITSKSVSKAGGRTSYRGLIKVYEGCHGVQVQRALRRAAHGRGVALRHLSHHGDRRARTCASSTRPPSRRSARSSCSTS